MEHRFKETTDKPERFFDILPADWQESITPFWANYVSSARIFVLESATEPLGEHTQVVGGGIVFSSISPDCQPMYHAEAKQWFDEGYLYIGFLWIAEQHRDKQLGTKWLQSLYGRFPGKGFWLSIDDIKLASFYKRNGFALMKKVELDYYPEWVMAVNSSEKDVMVPAGNDQPMKFIITSY